MVGAFSVFSGARFGRTERQKDIEAPRTNAIVTRGRPPGCGKFQHPWNVLLASLASLASRERGPRFVSLLSIVLLAFVIGACGSTAPGTIGALLGKRTDGRLFVRGVPPGQGADRAGLEIDDEILAIDGHPVGEMTQEDVRKAVRGNVGSTLTLTVQRGGQKRDVKVQRSPILADKPADKPPADFARPVVMPQEKPADGPAESGMVP
jgi:carboxyl-terminal processing protease